MTERVNCMIFKALLYISLTFFILGFIYKVWTWFSRSVGMSKENIPPFKRFFTFIKGFWGITCSLKLFTLIKAVILDLILQRRTFKESIPRWIMHILIYSGFLLLVLMLLLLVVVDWLLVEPMPEQMEMIQYFHQ